MSIIRKVVDKETNETSLEIDKRKLSKVSNPPNVKHLRYSRKLPVKCNVCPYRPEVEGGNGICDKYVEDGACVVRNDIGNMVDKYNERDGDKLFGMLKAEFTNNFEKLMFFESMEDMSGQLDPEVTKRINAMNNTFKIINEVNAKKQTVEITKTETLSDDMKNQIVQSLKLTKEDVDGI